MYSQILVSSRLGGAFGNILQGEIAGVSIRPVGSPVRITVPPPGGLEMLPNDTPSRYSQMSGMSILAGELIREAETLLAGGWIELFHQRNLIETLVLSSLVCLSPRDAYCVCVSNRDDLTQDIAANFYRLA